MDPIAASGIPGAPREPGDTPLTLRRVLWFWAKVALCLVALDFSLFETGWFWRYEPQAERDDTQVLRLWKITRQLETHPRDEPAAVAVGSSIVRASLATSSLAKHMQRQGVPGRVLNLGVDGLEARQASVLAQAARRVDPWLVVYGAAMRDFGPQKKPSFFIESIFADPDIDLAPRPGLSVEETISDRVQHTWRLYRYRPFVREMLRQELDSILRGLPTSAHAAIERTTRPPGRRPLAHFPARFRRGSAFADWQRWRRTRDFADYETYLRRAGKLLNVYRFQREAAWNLESGPEVEALRGMLRTYRERETRVVLVLFPENPVFRDPAAARYFDPARSDEVAAMLEAEAQRHGAHFIDLRQLLPADDFYDMIHANLAGLRTLDAFWRRLVEIEWQRHQRAAARRSVGGDAQ